MATPEPNSPGSMPPVKDPEFGELLRMMHVVDIERQKRDLALQELSTDQQKARLREELEKVYAAEGATVSKGEIDAAIEAHYADRYLFKPPTRNLSYRLARAYIARFWIFTRIVVPLMVLFAMVLTVVAVVTAQIRTRHLEEERAVELRTVDLYTAVNSAHADLALVRGKVSRYAEPNAASRLDGRSLESVRSTLQRNADQLQPLDQFLLKYCPHGDPKAAITQGNYHEVGGMLAARESGLNEVKQLISTAESGLAKLDELLAAARSLDAQIADIRGTRGPAAIKERAEDAYRSGKAAIAAAEPSGARKAAGTLEQLRKSLSSLEEIRGRIEPLSREIAAIAKERAALEQKDSLIEQMSGAIAQGDLPRASASLEKLTDLKSTLDQSYSLRIVNRPGTKSGFNRFPKSNSNSKVYYLVVEAVDRENRTLSKLIVNEEDQQSKHMAVWAERVPRELYDQVKDEKQKRGLIENPVLMTKERGYLTEQPGRLQKRTGQLTHWN